MIDISVIIPFYKGSQYLNYWLDILSKNFADYEKTYHTQCEAVFINDYPVEPIILPLEHPSFHVINLEKNKGIHGARAVGYHYAKGTYIVFLDQDDKIVEHYLTSQKHMIKDADAVVCNGYKERYCIKGKRCIYLHPEQAEKATALESFIMEKNWILSPGQVLLKKKTLPDLWLTEIMENNGADDYFLWILMLKNGSRFHVNWQKLYTHMEHGTNTSNENETMNTSISEMILLLEKNDVLNHSEIETLRQRQIQMSSKNRQYLKMIRVYDYWMYLAVRNLKIEKYLQQRHYYKIGIYGMNYIGNRLYDELCTSSRIDTVFAIDAAADSIVYDIPVITPENPKLPAYIAQTDVIIVTAIASYQEILHTMQTIYSRFTISKPVISIEEILLELINEVNHPCG